MVTHGHVEMVMKMLKIDGGSWTCRDRDENGKNDGGAWTCRDGMGNAEKLYDGIWRCRDSDKNNKKSWRHVDVQTQY